MATGLERLDSWRLEISTSGKPPPPRLPRQNLGGTRKAEFCKVKAILKRIYSNSTLGSEMIATRLFLCRYLKVGRK